MSLPFPSLPPFGRSALLLDLDGTLLDIAPRPDAVIVPPDLVSTLHRLRAALGEALAVVSGRPVEQIDALLGDAPYAVAGEHGVAIRHAPGAPIERADLPLLPAAWLEAAERIVAAHPGAMLETKANGFVLHYRAVPEAGEALRTALLPVLAGSAVFTVMAARKAWEVKPRGADKGVAAGRLMMSAPFAGRLPIFIGDDVTDEDGMRVAQQLGGAGLRVPDVFQTPGGVRSWLGQAAAGNEWPA